MTVIVAALNRQGVALAADSALTVGEGEQRKIFNSATKIFTLHQRAPVAVAVHGGWRINGVPWESIIKRYRDTEAPDPAPGTVAEHADVFLRWLDEAPFVDDVNTEGHVLAEVDAVYGEILAAAAPDDPAALSTVIEDRRAGWEALDLPENAPDGWADAVADQWGETVGLWRDQRFAGRGLDGPLRDALLRIGLGVLTRGPMEDRGSGLVFAGFGGDEFLPALQAWRVAGIVAGWARRTRVRNLVISENDPTLVEPFGQRPDVVGFLQGVDPGYQRQVETFLSEFSHTLPAQIIDALDLEDKAKEAAKDAAAAAASPAVDALMRRLEDYRDTRFVEPISSTVAALPKDELGAMAQSLVNITSLRRRYSKGAETVGGPVDVAVITRGDGFVWIQRKHYFDRDMNPQFAAKYLQ